MLENNVRVIIRSIKSNAACVCKLNKCVIIINSNN